MYISFRIHTNIANFDRKTLVGLPSIKCDLKPLYDAKLPITVAKKKDLLSLCSDE